MFWIKFLQSLLSFVTENCYITASLKFRNYWFTNKTFYLNFFLKKLISINIELKHFFCNKLKVIFLRHAKCEICRIVVFNLLRLKTTSEITEVPLANIGQINNIDKKCMHALTQKGPIRIGELENSYFLLDSHFF